MAETNKVDMKEEARGKGKTLVPEETAMFCEQVALILKSGIPLYDGMEALCESYKDTRYGQTFAEIERMVKEHGNLADAVEGSKIFPKYMTQMVRIGEAAGKLDDVMQALGDYYRREGKIRSSVRSAIVYPSVLVVMMAVVIGVLVSQVLPIFDRVFKNLGTEMTSSMTAVMNFGSVCGTAVLVLVLVLLAVLLGGYIATRMGKGAQVSALVMRWFPPIRRVMEKISSGRFASVLSMMMTAGFPIDETIRMSVNVIDDERTLARVRGCEKAVNEEGVELPKAIAQANLFEPIYNKMIQVGFYAGQMDQVMSKLADIYAEEVDDGIRRLVGMIEPTLVAILAVVIGGILLAVMLPLASIMSSIL